MTKHTYACWSDTVEVFYYTNFYGKKDQATKQPGWYYVPASQLTGSMPIKRDQWYITVDGSIVKASTHGVSSNDDIPQQVQFWVVRDKDSVMSEGTALYYDSDLKIKEGHSGRDIVGPYSGDRGRECPHCYETIFETDWEDV